MNFLALIATILGAYLILWLLSLIFIIWFLIWIAKKHPYLTMFFSIILIVGGLLLTGTIEFGNVPGLISGIATVVGGVVSIIVSSKELKEHVK